MMVPLLITQQMDKRKFFSLGQPQCLKSTQKYFEAKIAELEWIQTTKPLYYVFGNHNNLKSPLLNVKLICNSLGTKYFIQQLQRTCFVLSTIGHLHHLLKTSLEIVFRDSIPLILIDYHWQKCHTVI